MVLPRSTAAKPRVNSRRQRPSNIGVCMTFPTNRCDPHPQTESQRECCQDIARVAAGGVTFCNAAVFRLLLIHTTGLYVVVCVTTHKTCGFAPPNAASNTNLA